MPKLLFAAVMGLFIVTVISCSTEEVEQVSEQCDRQCLEGFVNQYLDGMVAHDASTKDFPYLRQRKTLWQAWITSRQRVAIVQPG